MSLSITLDWVSVTFKGMSNEAANWISVYACAKTGTAIKPLPNYNNTYRAESGILVAWHSDRTEMGHHLQFSGTTLRNLWEHYELDQRALIQTLLDFGGRFTRVDLAKDLQGAQVDLDKIYQEINARKHKGTAHGAEQHKSKNGGNTVYIGSYKSDKFIRVYNKQAETGQNVGGWERFELVMKSDYARALAWNLANNKDWSAVFDGVVLPTCNLPNNAHYQLFFPTGEVAIGLPKVEKHSDREVWIEKQVMPAVVKHFFEHPDSPSVKLLRRMLDEIERLQSEQEFAPNTDLRYDENLTNTLRSTAQ